MFCQTVIFYMLCFMTYILVFIGNVAHISNLLVRFCSFSKLVLRVLATAEMCFNDVL